MRLLSLVLALVILGVIITYYKNSLVPAKHNPDQTVKEQARQIVDEAKKTTEALQQNLEQQNRDLEKLQDQQ